MNIKFQDSDIEKFVLAGFLQGPNYWKNLPTAYFKDPLALRTYAEMQRLKKPPYNSYPTPDLLREKTEDVEVRYFVNELVTIPIARSDMDAYCYDLFEMYGARVMFDAARSIPNQLQRGKVEDIVRAHIAKLAELVNPFIAGTRERGFIYDSLQLQREIYDDARDNPEKQHGIPYGIRQFDEYTHGLKPDDIVLFYAGTGGFKTRVMNNLAYNFAVKSNRRTMVMTLEVPKVTYDRMIVARHSLQSLDAITYGKLGENEQAFKNALTDLEAKKSPLYIVDIPGEATSADIVAEFSKYYIEHGEYPEAFILDYGNEMSPVTPWNNTSEKLKNLGVEIRQTVRSYKVPTITALQENREGKKLKDQAQVDLEHIGEGHYFSNVCTVVIHLFQEEPGSTMLSMGIKKNRYGPKHVSFDVMIDPDHNYCGDFNPYGDTSV